MSLYPHAVLAQWLAKIICFVLIDFVAVGVCISWVTKTFAEKLLLKQTKNGECSVEPLYAWDIHCNSFFPVIVICYFTHAILLLVGLHSVFWTCFLWNFSTAAALSWYHMNTFRGYAILPFIRKPEYFILPIPFYLLIALAATAFGY